MLTTGRGGESVKKLKLLPLHSPSVLPTQKSAVKCKRTAILVANQHIMATIIFI